jgi:hypothetical protein
MVTMKKINIVFILIQERFEDLRKLDSFLFLQGELNAVDYCSFDNPSLCGLTTDMMTSWKQGTPINLHNVIKYDADFRNDGNNMCFIITHSYR